MPRPPPPSPLLSLRLTGVNPAASQSEVPLAWRKQGGDASITSARGVDGIIRPISQVGRSCTVNQGKISTIKKTMQLREGFAYNMHCNDMMFVHISHVMCSSPAEPCGPNSLLFTVQSFPVSCLLNLPDVLHDSVMLCARPASGGADKDHPGRGLPRKRGVGDVAVFAHWDMPSRMSLPRPGLRPGVILSSERCWDRRWKRG
jgi:hypothetical protein